MNSSTGELINHTHTHMIDSLIPMMERPSALHMQTAVKKRLQRLTDGAWASIVNRRTMRWAEWRTERWVDRRSVSDSRPLVKILTSEFEQPPRHAEPQEAMHIYTDGSWIDT